MSRPDQDSRVRTHLVPEGMRWSHDADSKRSDDSCYRLPHSEVLSFLMDQTAFLDATSSDSNDRCRDVIYQEQYPQLSESSEPTAERRIQTPAEISRLVENCVTEYASSHLASRRVKIGYTPVLRDHVYIDGCVTLPNAIVLGLPMRYAETNLAPEPGAGEEVTRNYMELGGLTLSLARLLRESGYGAEAHHPRGDEHCNCEALFIPHAVEAGFGSLGRHGSLISREFGPRVRLSMVTTDAPLPVAPGHEETGIEEFCTWCTKCLKACPVDAIKWKREQRRGSYRFIVDTSKCLPYFAQTDGCGICIAVCPYNKPDEAQSSRFYDQVLNLEWVRAAIDVKHSRDVKAMESFVTAARQKQADRDD